MTRLIDADKLHDLFDKNCVGDCNVCNFYTSVHYVIHNKDCKGHSYCGLIDNAPTVEERPKGKWKLYKSPVNRIYQCSCCGKNSPDFTAYMKMNFCPNCGADMRETDND